MLQRKTNKWGEKQEPTVVLDVMIEGESAKPHVSPQSQQLDDHLYGENESEDQVEEVHDGGEEFGLLVVLE